MEDRNNSDDGSTSPPPASDTPPASVKGKLTIFISYGHDASAPAGQQIAPLPERLKKDLEDRGHDVWVDFDQLGPGDNWMSKIEQGLEKTREDLPRGRFLFLMTPHSVRRDGFCLNEVLRAQDLHVKIVPALVIRCDRPLPIYSLQYLEMSDCVPCAQKDDEYNRSLQKLVEALEKDYSEPLYLCGEETALAGHLQPLNYSGNIRFHLPHFAGREWVFSKIRSWLADPDASRVFLLTGWAGTGKSAIAAKICKNWQEVKAFHVCVHDDSEKRNPRRAVRTLAYQLGTSIPEYRERLLRDVRWDALKDANAVALFDELFVTRLSGLQFPGSAPCLILVDALDEATCDGANEIAALISSGFKHTPSWLRLLVTTRPLENITARLSGIVFSDKNSIELRPDHAENKKDIRQYVTAQLEGMADDRQTLQNAVDAIAQRSEGVFLYAHWVCSELKGGSLKLDQTSTFPPGLSGIYQSFFDRLYLESKDYPSTEPILGVLATAYETLSKQMLADILGQSGQYVAARLAPLNPLFPCVDGRSYRSFHKSIVDWLLNDAPSSYRVDVESGHEKLANYCWAQCEPYLREDRKPLQTYPFRHGVRHLLARRRFGDAVVLLDYLSRRSKRLTEDDLHNLHQQAKLLTAALGDERKLPNESEAKPIPAEMLADLIAGLYMSEALKGGIGLLVKYHGDKWPAILEKLLARDDYVLRHTIADALSEDYRDKEREEQLLNIYALLDHPDINHQELGAYALQSIYADDVELIQPKYLNRLANGAIYPFRSALGDLLLGLGLQDVGSDDFSRLDLLKQVDAHSIFWNPIWDFNRMDVTWLQALDCFARDQPPDASADERVRAAHSSLRQTEDLRQEILKDVKLPSEVESALKGYYRLGVDSDLIPQDAAIVKRMSGLRKMFEVLFAHPLWTVTESAASLLASVLDDEPQREELIVDLFQHPLWRVQYGAAEASFLARFTNRHQLFSKAIETFYQHPEPLLRCNVAENLAAWIADTLPSKRMALLQRFEKQVRFWITNENEDAWILDHVYRLFHLLWQEGLKQEVTGLMDAGVSSLLAGDRVWYTMERQEFLLQIERRKRERVEAGRGACPAAPGLSPTP